MNKQTNKQKTNDKGSVQRAKKVMSDSRGLVDFAIRQVMFVLGFFGGKLKLQKDCNQSC